jgi:hypothetical protein
MIRMELSDTGKKANGEVLRRLNIALDVAEATGVHIRDRARRGHFATVAAPYAGEPLNKRGRRRKYVISDAYAQKLGVTETKWASSAALHRAAGGTPGYTTGGMWEGLRVRNYGTEGAIIEFGGSSLGSRGSRKLKTRKVKDQIEVIQSGNKVKVRQRREYAKDKEGNLQRGKAITMTTNRLKASAVFQRMKVGLLQPTNSESDAQVTAILGQLGKATALAFGAQGTLEIKNAQGDPVLIRAINQKIGG